MSLPDTGTLLVAFHRATSPAHLLPNPYHANQTGTYEKKKGGGNINIAFSVQVVAIPQISLIRFYFFASLNTVK